MEMRRRNDSRDRSLDGPVAALRTLPWSVGVKKKSADTCGQKFHQVEEYIARSGVLLAWKLEY
jgi:hypothetical protein